MGIYVDCAGVVLVSILLCSLCFCCMKLKADKLHFRHRRWTGADWTWGKWTMLRVNEHCTEPHTHTKTILFSFMFYMRSQMIAQQPLICVNECVPNHSRANISTGEEKNRTRAIQIQMQIFTFGRNCVCTAQFKWKSALQFSKSIAVPMSIIYTNKMNSFSVFLVAFVIHSIRHVI